MSRHHMLPPIIYTPAPLKPRETRRRRRVGYAEGTGATDETDENAEGGEGRMAVPAKGAAAPPSRSTPDEAAERRPYSTGYNVSENTLKALLELQVRKGPQGGGAVDLEKEEGNE